jgi:S1-C subfamily serine protease
VRTITYYGSAVGLDLSAHGMHKNLLLTAAHNVMDEDDGHYYEKVDVEVIVQDKASKARARVWSPLTVVWADAVIDLALVRADVDLPFVSVLATDDATENGELLAAVGHPGGGGLTVTFGYMVSKEVEMRIQEPWWYQASFTIYYGNSGGAVYDVYREQVIGIVVAGYGQGDLLAGNMGFFVSLPRIKSFLDTKGLRGKLDSMMPSKEGEHERAPEEGPGVPQGIPTDGQK